MCVARARAAQQNARRAGICGHVDKEAFFFLKCLVFVPLCNQFSVFSHSNSNDKFSPYTATLELEYSNGNFKTSRTEFLPT